MVGDRPPGLVVGDLLPELQPGDVLERAAQVVIGSDC